MGTPQKKKLFYWKRKVGGVGTQAAEGKIEEQTGGVEENTGDEKGFTTSLWCVFYFSWCAFFGGRKLDEKENWEGGDRIKC